MIALSSEQNAFTELAVAVGRVEEKVNGITSNRDADISFQQSVRDTFAEMSKENEKRHSKNELRLNSIESVLAFMKWLIPVMIPLAVIFSNWVSEILFK